MASKTVDKQLFLAIESGDLDAVKAALVAGASPNATKGKDGALRFAANRRAPTPVMQALVDAGADVGAIKDLIVWAATQPLPMLQAFLDAGAEVNGNSMAGTPVQVAARAGLIGQVALLLSRGADPNGGTLIGNALTDAVRGGHTGCVAALLKAGATPAAAERFGPMLPILVEQGDISTTKAMLDAGADLNFRYTLRGPHTRIKKAQDAASRAQMERLVQSVNAPEPPEVEDAASEESYEAMTARVNAEIDAAMKARNAIRASGATLLMIAVSEGSLELVNDLLARGAAVDLVDDAGRTAYVIAEEKGHTAIQQALRAKGGANPASLSPEQDLFLAAEKGDLSRLEGALKRGAPVDGFDTRKNTDGRTALIIAIERNQAAVVGKLLDLGASTEVKAKTSPSNARAFLDNESQERTPLAVAAALGRAEIVEALLARGADVKARDERKETALHLAAMAGHAQVAALLLAGKAEIDAKGQDFMTPLLYAAARGHAAVGLLLLAKGAKVTATDRSKETALHFAVSSRSVPLVQALVDHGADPNAANKYGTPPTEQGAHIPEIARILSAPPSKASVPAPPAKAVKAPKKAGKTR